MSYAVMIGHSAEFFKKHSLGLEAHITRAEKRDNWQEVKPFLVSAHLPFDNGERSLNIAAFDDAQRNADIAYLEQTIYTSAEYGVDRAVIHTCGYESNNCEYVGCYERMIDALKYLIAVAKKKKMLICIENMVLRNPQNRYLYGSYAADWLRIYEDVKDTNVRLTLDTSHATSSVLGYKTKEERAKHLYDFLARPELIANVHWSDSRIENQDALFGDLHLIPGDGDLPLDFHRKIKQLDALKVLEQDCSDEDSLRGINFIESL